MSPTTARTAAMYSVGAWGRVWGVECVASGGCFGGVGGVGSVGKGVVPNLLSSLPMAFTTPFLLLLQSPHNVGR